jgi:hypothetical protein
MEVLIPLAIMVLIVALSMRRFKPELWYCCTIYEKI